MHWLLLTQLSAFTNSISRILLKKTTFKYSSNISIWVLLLFSQIILLPLVIYKGIPNLSGTFWLYFILRIVVDTAALYFYGKAVKLGEMSKINPLSAISPVIVLISSIFINQEVPSILGIGGIITISIGIYWLNITKLSKNKVLEPIQDIIYDKIKNLYQNGTCWDI